VANRFERRKPELLAYLRAVPREGTDLRPWYLALSFRQTVERLMTVRRALALNALLDNMPLTIHDDDLLAGSMCALTFSGLPDGASTTEYDIAVE